MRRKISLPPASIHFKVMSRYVCRKISEPRTITFSQLCICNDIGCSEVRLSQIRLIFRDSTWYCRKALTLKWQTCTSSGNELNIMGQMNVIRVATAYIISKLLRGEFVGWSLIFWLNSIQF